MSNKRKNKRLDCLVPVEGKTGGPFEVTQTLDFSKNGMGFISKKRIAIGKKIGMEINLTQDDDPVLVIAVVKWVKKIKGEDEKYRIGFEFDDVLRGSKSRLSNYFVKK